MVMATAVKASIHLRRSGPWLIIGVLYEKRQKALIHSLYALTTSSVRRGGETQGCLPGRLGR